MRERERDRGSFKDGGGGEGGLLAASLLRFCPLLKKWNGQPDERKLKPSVRVLLLVTTDSPVKPGSSQTCICKAALNIREQLKLILCTAAPEKESQPHMSINLDLFEAHVTKSSS